MFASFILKASDDIVFGIVFIGCLTAFLEIKMRNDNWGIGERRLLRWTGLHHRSHNGWWKCSFIDPGRSAPTLPGVRKNRAESWAFAVLVLRSSEPLR